MNVHFVRNVGCGTGNGIAITRKRDWDIFCNYMMDLSLNGIHEVPLTVKYG